MKKINFITLFALLAISQFAQGQSFENIHIGNFYYQFSGDEAWISNKCKKGYYQYGWYTLSDCNIPESVEYQGATYRVTRITEASLQGSDISTLTIPQTVTYIDKRSFAYCRQLQSVIIPSSVTGFPTPQIEFSNDAPFNGCSSLRTIIYTRANAPANWTATTFTYVPDLYSYSSPGYSMNQAKIIEMISFDKKSFEYTGQSPTTTWTNNLEGYTVSLTMPTLKKDVGEYKEIIPATFTKDDESFTADVVYRYSITPVNLTFKASNASREYGEENPTLTYSCSGFVNGEDESIIGSMPIVTTTATEKSNVGEYPITISGGNADNYSFVYEPGVLTVTKAPLTAMVNDATKVYGSQNPAFTIKYFGLKNDETTPAWTTQPTFQTNANINSSVGNYVVSAVNGIPVNYDLGYITDGTLSIIPAQLTIKALDAVRLYYSDNPTFSYTCSGFVNGDNESVLTSIPILTTSAIQTSNVGTYEINVGETSSPNYSISYINGTLTITPRTLIASVGNYERPYNEENPSFVVTISGFVGNEDKNVLIEMPIASTTATKTSDVGTYPINVVGGSADNYNFSYNSGKLTINKAEQTITWEQDLSSLVIGEQVKLEATTTSGLPITYTISDNSIAEIYSAGNSFYLDCKKKGQTKILAVQGGNKNYYTSIRIYKDVVVSTTKPVSGITLAQDNYTLLSLDETVQIEATVLPADATNKEIRWSSSNENVCVVNDGKVTPTGYGMAIVMASTIEGGYSASCIVKVLEMGDANGDCVIDKADAEEVAYYILGRPSSKFIFVLADVNEDKQITILDAVGIINIMVNGANKPKYYYSVGTEEVTADNYTTVNGAQYKSSLSDIPDALDLSAISQQKAYILLPEGCIPIIRSSSGIVGTTSISIGNGHTVHTTTNAITGSECTCMVIK